MPYATFYRDTKLKLKRGSCSQRIANHIFCVFAIFRHNAVIPDLPAGLDMRRDFVEIEHTLIPTDHIRLQFPFPNADPPGFISERNALHQPFVHPLGVLQIVNILNLRNKVEWGGVAMAHQRNGQQGPYHLACARVIALLHGIAVNFPARQHVQLFEVIVQIFRPG